MRPAVSVTMVAVVVALCAPASAQIISTSLPTMVLPGEERDAFSAHFMVTPFAKWDYGEIFEPIQFDFQDQSSLIGFSSGTISAGPSSDFMVAGEIAFALGDSNWSIAVGGWYNKLGDHEFDYESYTLLVDPIFLFGAPLTAKVAVDLDMYEGHVGIFYKAFGIQLAYVRTTPRTGPLSDIVWWDLTPEDLPGDPGAPQPEPGEDFVGIGSTNDWSVHGVFRKSARRWSLSAGLGAYVMRPLEDSPFRFLADQTVLSAFATGSLRVFGPLTVDVSYWYVGDTGAYEDYRDSLESYPAVCSFLGSDCAPFFPPDPRLELPASISKSRLTVGLGFSF